MFLDLLRTCGSIPIYTLLPAVSMTTCANFRISMITNRPRWFDLSDAYTPQQSRAVDYLYIPPTPFITLYYCHPLVLHKRTYHHVSQRFGRGWHWFYSSCTGKLSRKLGAIRCLYRFSHPVDKTDFAPCSFQASLLFMVSTKDRFIPGLPEIAAGRKTSYQDLSILQES